MRIYSALLITYIGFFLSYGLNKYLTTHLDLHGLGDFNIGLSVATIFAVILNYGGNASTKRFIPVYIREKNFEAVAGCLRYYLKHIIYLSLWLIGFYFLATFIFHYFRLEELEHAAKEIVLLAPVIALGMFLGSALQARHKAYLSLLSDKLVKPGLFLLICIAWLYWFGSPDLSEVIAIAFVVLFVTIFLEMYFVKKVMPFNITSVKPVFFKEKWNKVGVPLLYSALANALFIHVEVLMLEVLHPSEKEVGVFSLLVFIVSIIWINFSTISSVIIPQISETQRNDVAGRQKIYSKGLSLVFITNLAFCIIIWLFADAILETFSTQMLEYKTWLIVILIGACINSILDLTSLFLRYTGYQEKEKQNTNFVLVVTILITPPLIYFYGMSGAVLALVSVNFLRGVNGARLMKKYVGVKPLISF